jgi:hypothetical protein
MKNVKTTEEDHLPEIDLSNPRWKVLGRRHQQRLRRVSLRALREALGKTQAEVASAAQTDQAEVSRLERREDFLLSTLERYARGLGGTVEVSIRIGDRTFLIATGQ